MEKSQPDEKVEKRPEEKPENARTPGLKMLDVFIYPVLTNLSVFVISVAATYLTARGGDKNAQGKLVYGKLGKWFQDRGEWMTGKFKALGMSEKQADMSKMVFFSFADGSAMAPAVKVLEDNREQIGRWLDEKMGTVPDDPGAYQAEPKQSWLSLLGGRVVTLAMVIPTAVFLGKTGLNDALFNNPGKQVGAAMAKKPWVKRNIPAHVDVAELTRVGFFEAFYTSLCTLGLYLTSRRIAYFHHKKKNGDEEKAGPSLVTNASAAPPPEEKPAEKIHAREELKKPRDEAATLPAGHLEKYNAEAAGPSASLGA